MTFTSADLTGRIDPNLAVDRALTPTERLAFHRHALTGQHAGAEPADWIDEVRDNDGFLHIVEPWWELHGPATLDLLMQRHKLPEPLSHNLLSCALYATIAIAQDPGASKPRLVIEIADGAALWARGYADALGWTPEGTDT